MNKPRQRRNRFYYEKLKQEKFKEAVKALPINIETLTKGKQKWHNSYQTC